MAGKSGATPPITLIAPFPPPLSGQTAYSLYLVETLKPFGAEVIPLPSRADADGWWGIIRKLLHSLVAAARLAFGRKRWAVFIVLDGGIGLLINLLFILLLRLRGAHKILLSHHSFAYIDRRSLLMALIVRLSGNQTTHLFLCKSMERRLCDRYRTKISARVISNVRRSSRTVTPHGVTSPVIFTLGYLSNITFEKGIAEYFDLVEALIADGEDICGKIGGPANSEVANFIQSRLVRCQGRVEWVGPVYGDEKDVFLSNLNVFVFPTNYINEAQPNVLFEALSHGVPAITIARGCIEQDLAQSGSLTVRSADSFVGEALPYAKMLIERHRMGDWSSVSALAASRFLSLHAEATRDEAELIRFMLDV